MQKIFTVIAVAIFSISLFSINSFSGEHEEGMKHEMKSEAHVQDEMPAEMKSEEKSCGQDMKEKMCGEEKAPAEVNKDEVSGEVKPAEVKVEEEMMQGEKNAAHEVMETAPEAGAELEVQAEEAIAEPEPEPVLDVLGSVSRIAENSIVIVNERDNKEYTLFSDDSGMLKNIEPGYRVEAMYTGDKLVDLTILGVPVTAEPIIIKMK